MSESIQVVASDSSLAIGRCSFSRIAAILPADLSAPEWREAGSALNLANESTYFWIGDWLLAADKIFNLNRSAGGERMAGKDHQPADKQIYATAIEKFSISQETLRACRWVAQNVPISIRRPELSWQFHQQVASLAAKRDAAQEEKEKAQKLQAYWLNTAIEQKLTVEQFRIAVRSDKSPKSKLLSEVKLSAASKAAGENHTETPISLKGDDRGDETNLALIAEACRATQRMIDWYSKNITEELAPSVKSQLKKDLSPFIDKMGAVIELHEGMA